ncbi:putative integral membrane protein [Corynebacterium kutscheri]|uniref:Integral membrane protein n=1 Tax=Corynebacterium kutscheri TaxID=35755 RepID=A0A0F6R3C5_9CORY|nr:hypothetical protein [Corynebacterium kutscheri]AKE42198.1 hypothetical protein UL82_10320 [Corynebacterium kutscheri]VEH05780.1 putative integral membrane protein [Corynebacterium kutscheri]VEH10541.1 putative integral membrane protein [Corynebacterium kutscheri]VEH81673.1 putative integral membrane protein [Corynebacterium kutscheri]
MATKFNKHQEHPENDLSTDADFANRYRPDPTDFDELAACPDPLLIALANRRSTYQAIAWAVMTPILTFIIAFILALVARYTGGMLCDFGQAKWICSRSAEIWWPISTSIVPVLGVIGCAIMLYRKYTHYLRWRPWMGTFWFLVPFAMLWMVTVLQMSIVGH